MLWGINKQPGNIVQKSTQFYATNWMRLHYRFTLRWSTNSLCVCVFASLWWRHQLTSMNNGWCSTVVVARKMNDKKWRMCVSWKNKNELILYSKPVLDLTSPSVWPSCKAGFRVFVCKCTNFEMSFKIPLINHRWYRDRERDRCLPIMSAKQIVCQRTMLQTYIYISNWYGISFSIFLRQMYVVGRRG